MRIPHYLRKSANQGKGAILVDMSKSGKELEEQPYRVYTGASIGQAIRHYRRKADLTQSELADLVGLAPTYLSRLENGEGTEELRRIIRILKQLEVRMTLQHADW
jgi:DNA-binding XRE family transcriptional regulator